MMGLDDPSMTHICIHFWTFVLEWLSGSWHQTSIFHSLKSRKKKPLGISHPRHAHISLATKGHQTFLPGMVISPSCFHSTLLQFTLISLQQFRDTGLLSHVTSMSPLSKIRMGVTLIFFLDSYSKISMVSLQIYSPAWNTEAFVTMSWLLLILRMTASWHVSWHCFEKHHFQTHLRLGLTALKKRSGNVKANEGTSDATRPSHTCYLLVSKKCGGDRGGKEKAGKPWKRLDNSGILLNSWQNQNPQRCDRT